MVKSNNSKSNKLSPQQFVKQSMAELKKVVWPTKQQVIRMTLIVTGVSIIVGALIGGLDYIFTYLVGLIIK